MKLCAPWSPARRAFGRVAACFASAGPFLVRLLLSASTALVSAWAAGGDSEQLSFSGAPPAVRSGPMVDVLKVKASRADRARVVVDGFGQAHVLLAVAELKQVLEVVVRADGTLDSRVIRSGELPASIDAAFDERGRLHALLDVDHWLLEDDVWRRSAITPWQEAGVKAQAARFVPGTPRLTWSFHIDGAEVDAKWRPLLLGPAPLFGFTRGIRAVLVSQTTAGFGPWVVIGLDQRLDTEVSGLSSDQLGNTSVVYQQGDNFLLATIDKGLLEAGDVAPTVAAGSLAGGRRVQALPASQSRRIGVLLGISRIRPLVAADSQGGVVLLGHRNVGYWLIRGGVWTGPVEWPYTGPRRGAFSPFPLYGFCDLLTPESGDSFACLTFGPGRADNAAEKDMLAYYLRYSDGKWSGVMDLGPSANSGVAAIASAGNGKTFVIWSMNDRIVGRWVERQGIN